MGRLDGKVAMITGGGSGIGAASARLFAREGARVILCDVNQAGLDSVVSEITASGGEALGMVADVTNSAALAQVVAAGVERFGALHILFANAGIGGGKGTAAEMDEDAFNQTIAINLGGAFLASKHALPHIIAAGGGSIVFTASELAIIGSKRNLAYTASKAGILGMTRSMALDHAPDGVRVNALCPGPIYTPMLQRSIDRHENPSAYEQEMIDELPMGRIGQADEIAHVALFLASDDSSYMTGSTVVSDGGATII